MKAHVTRLPAITATPSFAVFRGGRSSMQVDRPEAEQYRLSDSHQNKFAFNVTHTGSVKMMQVSSATDGPARFARSRHALYNKVAALVVINFRRLSIGQIEPTTAATFDVSWRCFSESRVWDY